VPFEITFTLIEPGPTDTGFGAALDRAPESEVYDATPAGDVRRAIASGDFKLTGDADRTVAAMIEAGDTSQPTARVTLGGTAYISIEKALTARLDALRAQRDVAFAADRS
jgi:hypothetical protein